MSNEQSDDVDIATHLHLETGISDAEQSIVIEALQPLAGLLKSLDRETLKIEAWVKNRNERGQLGYATIRAKGTDIVAQDDSSDLQEAFIEIRKDLKRQLGDLSDKRSDRRR